MSDDRIVRVATVGDVMFQERLDTIPTVRSEGVQAALASLKRADLRFINCEMPLTRAGHRVEKNINIRADPDVAMDLVSMGFDVATVANNHMLDYGHDGLLDTIAALDIAGLDRVGGGRDLEEALRPCFREVRGRRIAFLGVASTLPSGSAADGDRPGIAPVRVAASFEVDVNLMSEQPGSSPLVRTRAIQQDVDRVCEGIAAANREADLVLVAVHWGMVRTRVAPYQGLIAEYQPVLGRAFVDAGADLVLGTHSHNLHGVEVYKGKPIFYSLGHFLFHRPYGYRGTSEYMEPETVIVLADLGQHTLRVHLAPILLNREGFPEVPPLAERERIHALIAERSARFGTRFLPGEEGVEIDLSWSKEWCS